MPLVGVSLHSAARTSPVMGCVFCRVSKSHTSRAATALLTFPLVAKWIPVWLHTHWVNCQGPWRPSGCERLHLCPCWHNYLQCFQAKWEPMAVNKELVPADRFSSIRQLSFPTHISPLKRLPLSQSLRRWKTLFLSLDGHVINFYRRKASVFSLSHCQSSCCFIPWGTEQLSGTCMCFPAVASTVTTKNNTRGR